MKPAERSHMIAVLYQRLPNADLIDRSGYVYVQAGPAFALYVGVAGANVDGRSVHVVKGRETRLEGPFVGKGWFDRMADAVVAIAKEAE